MLMCFVWQLPAYISDDVDHHLVLELASHELHVSLDGLATTGELKAPAKFKGESSADCRLLQPA